MIQPKLAVKNESEFFFYYLSKMLEPFISVAWCFSFKFGD
jgi:hypothetical protein